MGGAVRLPVQSAPGRPRKPAPPDATPCWVCCATTTTTTSPPLCASSPGPQVRRCASSAFILHNEKTLERMVQVLDRIVQQELARVQHEADAEELPNRKA